GALPIPDLLSAQRPRRRFDPSAVQSTFPSPDSRCQRSHRRRPGSLLPAIPCSSRADLVWFLRRVAAGMAGAGLLVRAAIPERSRRADLLSPRRWRCRFLGARGWISNRNAAGQTGAGAPGSVLVRRVVTRFLLPARF